MKEKTLEEHLAHMPVVAALRGIKESEVDMVCGALMKRGITVLEVPVRTKNAALSPIEQDALKSLRYIKHRYDGQVHVAAGTVMRLEDLPLIRDIGINTVLSTALNDEVLKEAVQRGMDFFPGVETVSEAVRALQLGACGLKLFPAAFQEPDGTTTIRHSPGYVRYLAKFFSCPIIPSGDLLVDDLPRQYLNAGAAAINIGAQLYEVNVSFEKLEERAHRLVTGIKEK